MKLLYKMNYMMKFVVGNKIMLEDTTDGKTALVTIDSKLPDLRTIHFTPATGFSIKKDKCIIYKSKAILLTYIYFGE